MASGEKGQLSNKWIAPVHVFRPGDRPLKSQIQSQTMVYRFSADLWEQACIVVDDVLGIILSELQTQAQRSFENLAIDVNFIRQGSARQGLKIVAPDEFDVIVPFQLSGLRLQEVRLKDTNGLILPGQMRLRVMNHSELNERCPRLQKLGVFQMDQGTCYINTRVLQEKVFKSLFDKTSSVTEDNLLRKGYSVTRGSRPPSINITISSDLPFPIDVDFVPGLYLGDENVLVSASATMHPVSITVNFPRFGIMKWINKGNTCINEKDKDIIWRNCSSSYERYMFDICLGERYRLYFVTVCRIMKAVVKTLRERQNHAANLLNSYHLKTITMYCIQLMTISTIAPQDFHLGGVREALGYFLKFLKLVFDKETLPDFFLGNEYLGEIFPDSYFANEHRKYNLFDKENASQVKNAKYCFSGIEKALEGCYTYSTLNESVIRCFENKVLRM